MRFEHLENFVISEINLFARCEDGTAFDRERLQGEYKNELRLCEKIAACGFQWHTLTDEEVSIISGLFDNLPADSDFQTYREVAWKQWETIRARYTV